MIPTPPILIKLDDFKKKRPKHASYFEYLENYYSDPLRHGEHEICPDLPQPNRLLAERVLAPMTFLIPPQHPDFGNVLSQTSDFFQHAAKLDLNLYAEHLLGSFPVLRENLNKALPGQDAHDFYVARLTENLHAYHQAPVIKYHPDLMQLLRTTKVDSTGKIPVQFLRSPYDVAYFDFREGDRLPMVKSQGEDLNIVGLYLNQAVYQGDLLEGYAKHDPTVRRALDEGTMSLDEEVVALNFVFIGESPDDVSLDEGYMTLTFAVAYSPSIEASISDVIKAHLPDDAFEDGVPDNVVLYDHIREPLDLVLNSLLYMTSDDDHREHFKVGTELEIEYKRTNKPKKKRQLEKKLRQTAHEYTRIGKQYKLMDTDGREVARGKKTTHTRAGHWRHQRYGENRALSKVIWIRPMIIGAGTPAPAKDVIVQ